MYMFSILLVIGSNIAYHMSQKLTPNEVNPFISLLVTYLTSALLSFFALFFWRPDKGFILSIKDLNWTSVALGIALVGLEFGYLMAYRSGWSVSLGSLVANIIVATLLIPIGIIFFKESFELSKLTGAVFCIIGLLLIGRK